MAMLSMSMVMILCQGLCCLRCAVPHRDVPRDAPGDVLRDAPHDVPGDAPRNAPKDAPGGVRRARGTRNGTCQWTRNARGPPKDYFGATPRASCPIRKF